MKKIKILYILRQLEYGGVETVVTNYYKYIDKEKFDIDFVVTKVGNHKLATVLTKNTHLYVIPDILSIFKFRRVLLSIVKNNHYDIIHSHINLLNFIPLSICKKYSNIRIAHNHTLSHWKDGIRHLVKLALKKFSKVGATTYFACSSDAGYWMFGKQFGKGYVINNGIEFDRYCYDDMTRNRIRKQYDIEDNLIIGHIGRFIRFKNHEKVIQVFQNILKVMNNSKLILIGNGPFRKRIQKKIQKLNLQGKVIFLKDIDNVQDIIQGFDIFILPSLYEGLGIVSIECQASNLNCFLSDKVPMESRIISTTQFLSLKDDWDKKIISTTLNKRKSIYNERFDIRLQTKKLEEIYMKLVRGLQ